MLLHRSSTPQLPIPVQRSHCLDVEDLSTVLVRQVLGESLQKLQQEDTKQTKSIRWELGACWVQHLQSQTSGKTESKKCDEAKVEPAVKGLGKNGGLLKDIKKKSDDRSNKTDQGKEVASTNSSVVNKNESEKHDEEKEIMWRKLLPEAAYMRLKESETGLHLKVLSCSQPL